MKLSEVLKSLLFLSESSKKILFVYHKGKAENLNLDSKVLLVDECEVPEPSETDFFAEQFIRVGRILALTSHQPYWYRQRWFKEQMTDGDLEVVLDMIHERLLAPYKPKVPETRFLIEIDYNRFAIANCLLDDCGFQPEIVDVCRAIANPKLRDLAHVCDFPSELQSNGLPSESNCYKTYAATAMALDLGSGPITYTKYEAVELEQVMRQLAKGFSDYVIRYRSEFFREAGISLVNLFPQDNATD